jgi:hypothetical protein
LWHIVAAYGLFMIICFVAIALNLFTDWMVWFGTPAYITSVGRILEYLIFAADVMCFVIYVIKEASLLIYQIVQQ